MSRFSKNKVAPLNGGIGGSLLRHTKISSSSDADYISRIPKYIGTTIPPILTRNPTITLLSDDYYDFVHFLNILAQRDGESAWIIAGLLVETDMAEDVPIGGQSYATGRHVTTANIVEKQILCKRISRGKIMVIINVAGSEMREGISLNKRYLKKIMFVNTQTASVLVFSLKSDGATERPDIIPIDNITHSLSDTPVYVVDPNKLSDIIDAHSDADAAAADNVKTNVDWFWMDNTTAIDMIDINMEEMRREYAGEYAAYLARTSYGGKRRTKKNNYATRRKIKTRACKVKRRRRRTSRK